MCTAACKSSYQKHFDYLNGLTTIPKDNKIYKLLQTKRNLKCVNTFLASIATKVE